MPLFIYQQKQATISLRFESFLNISPWTMEQKPFRVFGVMYKLDHL